MADCPSCGRPLAVARPRCLYCGAAVRPATAPAPGPATPGELPPATVERILLILDLAGADVSRVASALQLTRFEADQRVRRGGRQLHRILDRDAALQEAARLTQAGLRVTALPEGETRGAARPVVAIGGRLATGALRLRTTDGDLAVLGTDLRLVVRGPIVRERQTLRAPETGLVRRVTRQWDDSRTEPGYCLHLHRASDVRPVELNPDAFEFAEPALEAPLVQMTRWIEALAPAVEIDDGFRWLPPALGTSAGTTAGIVGSAEALGEAARRQRKDKSVLLDNLAQFRFYSAWRGALRPDH
jgi:hypothetical protein